MDAIMDIERKSREIIEAADDLRRRQSEELCGEIEKREAAMLERLGAEKEKLKRDGLTRQAAELRRLEAEYAEKRDGLEEKFRENRARWIEDIVRGCIGG